MTDHVLVGKTVTSISIADDRGQITLGIAGGSIIGTTYGDCCSDTWIENVDNEDALIGHTVVSVEEIEMPDLGNVGTPHHEFVDQVGYYGTRITTDAGICVIDFRNDSSGYYGGSLDWSVQQ